MLCVVACARMVGFSSHCMDLCMHLQTRTALANVRERMNERAFAMLEAYIKKVCTPDAKAGGGGRRVLATGGGEEQVTHS